MSAKNSLRQKKIRRFARDIRHKRGKPPLAVLIDPRTVRCHRYLRDHALPASDNIANVQVGEIDTADDAAGVMRARFRKRKLNLASATF